MPEHTTKLNRAIALSLSFLLFFALLVSDITEAQAYSADSPAQTESAEPTGDEVSPTPEAPEEPQSSPTPEVPEEPQSSPTPELSEEPQPSPTPGLLEEPQPSPTPEVSEESSAETLEIEPAMPEITKIDGAECLSGEVLVKFNDSTSNSAMKNTLQSLDSAASAATTPDNVVVADVPEGETVESFVDTLEDQSNVDFAQPNYVYRLAPMNSTLAAAPNDEYASNQWYLDLIGAYDAWNYTAGSSNIRVAVIDTGIDDSHPDLSEQVVADTDIAPYDYSLDDDGHGTMVAGIIAAKANNSIGVAGIAPGVRLISIDVFTYNPDKNAQFADTADVIEGIKYAVNHNANVINMSLGQYSTVVDTAFQQAVEDAVKAGAVVVCAAGNENTSATSYPSDFSACISVIATDSEDNRASYSDYGSAKDIAAPGGDNDNNEYLKWPESGILCAYPDSLTDPGYEPYQWVAGTSMAAPVVSGVAALLLSMDDSLTVSQVKQILYSSAADLGTSGKDNNFGNGRVDAYAAVAYQPTQFVTTRKDLHSIQLSWKAVPTVEGYEIYRSTSASSGFTLLTTRSSNTFLDSGLTTSTKYYYKVRAYKTINSSLFYGGYTPAKSMSPGVPTVTGVSAARNGATSIKVSWNSAIGAQNYDVYRSTTSSGTYVLQGTTSATSFINTSLTPNVTYYYKVVGYATVGGTKFSSSYSSAASAKATVATVTGTKATPASTTSIKVSWSKADESTGYEVYRATSSSGTYSLIKTTSSTSYTNTGLTFGKKYYYKVRAYKTVSGKKYYGAYSSVDSAKPAVAAVSGVKATSASTTSIKVSWSKTAEASGYELYRATSSGGTYKLVKTTSSTSSTNTGLTIGKKYYYKVRAYKTVSGKKYYGAYSSVVNAKPAVAAVSGVKAAPASTTSIKVSWSKTAEASGYELYRATSSGGTYSLVKTTSSTSYTNSGLTTGKTYYYKVRAYKTVSGTKHYGAYSSVANTKPTVVVVTGVKAYPASTTSITVSWGKTAEASGYELYRSKTGVSGSYTKIQTTSATSFTDTGLTTGKTYYYTMRAYAIIGGKTYYGAWAPVVNTKPTVVAVTGAKASPASTTSIKVSWSKTAEASGYELYRATSSGGTYKLVKTTSSISYTNSSLTTGKTYYYKVRAYKTVNSKKYYGAYSSVVKAKPAVSAVSGVKAAPASTTSIKISWSKTAEASGYAVYRATSASGTYKQIERVTSTSYKDTGLTIGKKYYYKIRAYKTVDGERYYGANSSMVSAVPSVAAVSGVKAASASATSIAISWSKTAEASGYELYRSDASNGTYKLVRITSSTSYTNIGLITGKTYYYKARAYKTVSGKKYYGAYSSAVNAKPVLAVVANPKAKRTSTTSIQLSWTKSAEATGYQIYRSTSLAGTYQLIKTTASSSYTDAGLAGGQIYYYKVRAYKTVNSANVYSGYSSVFSEGSAYVTFSGKTSVTAGKTYTYTFKLITKSTAVANANIVVGGAFQKVSGGMGLFIDNLPENASTEVPGTITVKVKSTAKKGDAATISVNGDTSNFSILIFDSNGKIVGDPIVGTVTGSFKATVS